MFVSCVIFVFLCCTSISLLNFTVLHVRLIRVLLKISQSVSQIVIYVLTSHLTDEEHHIGACPLRPLPIGYVTQFGLDYMHLACLGVMRRLIVCWKGPYGTLQVRLGRKMIGDLSSRLLYVAQLVPVEFTRRPRSIDEVLRWKAT